MSFATESDVRKAANLRNFDEITPELLLDNLSKAHEDILAGTMLTDESGITNEIISAESLLAVSHIFRSIVVSCAVSTNDWRTSGLQVNESSRLNNLMKLSEVLWEESWCMLRPYLRVSVSTPVVVTKGDQ